MREYASGIRARKTRLRACAAAPALVLCVLLSLLSSVRAAARTCTEPRRRSAPRAEECQVRTWDGTLPRKLCWAPDAVTTWDCEPRDAVDLAPGVAYRSETCALVVGTKLPWAGDGARGWARGVGPLAFHVVTVDLEKADLLPQVAHPLRTVSEFADNRTLAAINGGYFWELNKAIWADNVCWSKTRAMAQAPASPSSPSHGASDSLVKSRGVWLGGPCDTAVNGIMMPAVLQLHGRNASIAVYDKGCDVEADTAIGNAPNLVSTRGARTFVDIPHGDTNLNIVEKSAQSAVGVRPGGREVVMVSHDGIDGCAYANATCGMSSIQLAYYLKDRLSLAQAMQLDGGGSTTLWVRGRGVVTSNGFARERLVANALMVS